MSKKTNLGMEMQEQTLWRQVEIQSIALREERSMRESACWPLLGLYALFNLFGEFDSDSRPKKCDRLLMALNMRSFNYESHHRLQIDCEIRSHFGA